jgi:hypothetical protein
MSRRAGSRQDRLAWETREGPAPPGAARGGRPGQDRDRRVVRRGFVAGGVVWVLVAGPLAVAAGGDDRAVLVAVLLGLTFGAFAASGWLLVAAILDLWVGEPPARRRVVWTAAATLLALISPFLLLAAGG